jgi:hypothetical protein
MRLRIGENARVSLTFSPIRAKYVYQILCQVNALLLSLYCNHNVSNVEGGLAITDGIK